jgi:hypothetical protein
MNMNYETHANKKTFQVDDQEGDFNAMTSYGQLITNRSDVDQVYIYHYR